MNLTECKIALTELGMRPTKSLGQNFLVDSNILDIIVRAARLDSRDAVLEIGPGLGGLTAKLLTLAGTVVSIEKDARLHDWLNRRFADARNLKLICADALEAELPPILRDGQFKLVANLPYCISSALIERFVENPPRPVSMTLTMQREMGERLAANPSTKDYGALTLFTQLRYHVTLERIISPHCFFPPPEVQSAVVVLDRREPRVKLKEGAPFQQIVRAAFAQRRKMLRKMLVQSGFAAQSVDAAFEKLKVASTARGEELSLENFITLANELAL
jgi:16S rRNA (adenine1518-N6/adenine1519-N6)-dimethyltransferase